MKAGMLAGGGERNAMEVPAREFNQRAEDYYRNYLRLRQTQEAFTCLREDVTGLLMDGVLRPAEVRRCLSYCLPFGNMPGFVADAENEVVRDLCSEEMLKTLINIVLLSVAHDQMESSKRRNREEDRVEHSSLLR
jgi:hypothetical protein